MEAEAPDPAAEVSGLKRTVDLQRRLAVARGDEPADLVLRGGRAFSSFTREWLDTDVALVDGFVPGRPVEEIPTVTVPEWVRQTVRVGPVSAESFRIPWLGGRARVVGLVPDQLVTDALVYEPRVEGDLAVADPSRDLSKIALLERHLGTGRVGLGFVRGFGLARGAFGATLAHDAHNLVVVGVDDDAMATVVARLVELGGGEGRRQPEGGPRGAATPGRPPPLGPPAGGRPRRQPCTERSPRGMGVGYPHAFQVLAFLALSVIPSLKITDRGLVDVDRFQLIPLAADEPASRDGSGNH